MSMHLATGAMGCLLPKLAELLLEEEYTLKKSVKEGIESLEKEMKSMHAALCNVAEVLPDQLDEQVKLWAGEVRELSFDMEDVIDKFLVHVDDSSEHATNSSKLEQLTKKFAGLFAKGKVRPKISDVIKDINEQVNELVGIAGTRDQELMKLLSEGDNMSKKMLKVVSVVGLGGLGKTTLVKTVYDKIKGDFDCKAFVHAGRNAEVKKVFIDILLGIGINGITLLGERQLINELRESLENKRGESYRGHKSEGAIQRRELQGGTAADVFSKKRGWAPFDPADCWLNARKLPRAIGMVLLNRLEV